MRIEAVTLKKFRGASVSVPIRFEKGKPLVLIFGENGTGKTTIVDALDFVCNQAYGSLKYRSSTSPKKHLPSIGSRAAELEVTLDADGKTWTAHLESAGPRTSGPPAPPALAVLRRQQILEVINAEPKKRYEALGDLLRLPGVGRSEAHLREALRERESRYDDAVKAKQQADEALENLWEAEGRPPTSALSWARACASADMAALESSVLEKGRILALLDLAEATSVDLAVAQTKHADAKAAHLAAQKELVAAEKSAGGGSAALVDLLTDAQRVLPAGVDLSTCPLCESAERVAGLAQRVAARLADLTHLSAAGERAAKAGVEVERALGALERAMIGFGEAVRRLGTLIRAAGDVPGSEVVADWSKYTKLFEATDGHAIPDVGDEVAGLWPALRAHGPRLKEAHRDDQRALNQFNAVKQHVATVDEKDAAAKDHEAVSARLREVLEVVEGQRKGYVDGLLASVSTKAQTMYASIHPGEGLGAVRFYLKPSVMGSLECDGSFEGTAGLPPQAYYSDSHLDTLGICVFLALAQATADGTTSVVLDDVLTSADAPHAERLIRMLQNETERFDQIIVTTHYRPWRERFRFRPAALVQLIDLGAWSLARGIWPAKTKMKVEDLRLLLETSPLDGQAVASKAGVFLEELLRFICLRYRCKVTLLPEPTHTIGDYAAAITSKLTATMRVEVVGIGGVPGPPMPLAPLLADATGAGWVRNQVGAHFSVAGLGVPDADIAAFAESCLALATALVCDACGEMPPRNRSGSYWECQCAALRLHPLTGPNEPPPPVEV